MRATPRPPRTLFLLLVAIAVALPFVSAQEPKESAAIPWELDVTRAKALAKEQGKDLFINFTGSDWCGYCKRLDREVFAERSFLDATAKDFVFLLLDFPTGAEAQAKVVDAALNERLREKYGVEGFPTIILCDAAGNPYARTGYQPVGAEQYATHITELRDQGEALRALTSSTDDEKEEELLIAAFPAMVEQNLLKYPDYAPYVARAEKLDSLKGALALYRAGLELKGLLMTPEPEWEKVHALLDAHEGLAGPDFLNACWGCATLHLVPNGEIEAAQELLRRMLTDPMLEGSEEGQKVILDKIAEIGA